MKAKTAPHDDSYLLNYTERPTANLFMQKSHEFSFHVDNVKFTLITDHAFVQATVLKKEFENIMHTHPYYEVFLVTEGSLTVLFEDHSVEIGSDSAIIISPNIRHHTKIYAPNTMRYNLNFYFAHNSLETAQNLYSHLKHLFDGFTYIFLRYATKEREIISRFHEYINTDKDFMLTAYFYEFILNVLDKCGNIKSVPPLAPMLLDSNINRIYKLDRIFHSYYMYNIPLKYIADHLFLSVRQLNRIIQRHYGHTYTEQIITMRMQAARLLLVNTALSVTRVSHEVGYLSLSGFYKAFYKTYGCRPIEYKNRVTNKKIDFQPLTNTVNI